METEQENGCTGIKRKKPLELDWKALDPVSFGDDDRPPEIVVISKKNPKDSCTGEDVQDDNTEDLEFLGITDRQIEEFIARSRHSLKVVSAMPDKGERYKETLRRHKAELERRKKIQSEKVDKICEETKQLSYDGDDGASCGKQKGDQKSSSTSKVTKMFIKKLEEDKDSRTINAFQGDLSFIKLCQGRKPKPNSQLLGKGNSRMGLSSKPASARKPSRAPQTPLVDTEKHINSNNNEKDGDSITSSPDCLPRDKPCSLSQKNFHQDQPSRNLRLRCQRDYHLVDEDPPIKTIVQYEELGDCMKDVKVYYPSRDDPCSIEVSYTDMACLAPGACLSSTIMTYYIRYLQQSASLFKSATCNYHFFNTYFYNKLEKLSYEDDTFLKFRKWWKGVNIFEKAYILLPIHESAHWSLVIICIPSKEDELGPSLLHLDSLQLHDSETIFYNIRRYLKEEWSYLKRSDVPLNLPITDEIWENLFRRMNNRRVMVPQQMNEYDCGLFVLFYMERFIKEAPERLRENHLSMFSSHWFDPEEASNLRVRIHNLLVEEFKDAKEKEARSALDA